ncbi:hypothetical protein M3J09_002207 [Ascochyta lentis]
MSSPITFPPSPLTAAPLTWAQTDEALLIAPTAQSLDAAPPLSMHLVRMHVMTHTEQALSNFSRVCTLSPSLNFLVIPRINKVRVPASSQSKRWQPDYTAPLGLRLPPGCMPVPRQLHGLPL